MTGSRQSRFSVFSKTRIKETILASLLAGSTLLLFVPLQLFLGNFYEFTLTVPGFQDHGAKSSKACTTLYKNMGCPPPFL